MRVSTILADSTIPTTAPSSKIPRRWYARPISIARPVKGRRGKGFSPHRGYITASETENAFVREFQYVASGARKPGEHSLHPLLGIAESIDNLEGQPNSCAQTPMPGASKRLQSFITPFCVAPRARNFYADFDHKSRIPLPLREFGLPRLVYRFRARGATQMMRSDLAIRPLDGATPFYAPFFCCLSRGATASR